MARQATRDTAAETAVRTLLHAAGLRYRVNAQPLPGLRRTADIVFTRRRVAVFVDGCFWHACPDHGTVPKTNADWWTAKLARNIQRDQETNEQLAAAGWHVVRVWEHEDPRAAAHRIEALVRIRPTTTMDRFGRVVDVEL